MKDRILIKPLFNCREEIPILVDWFLQEWLDHYGEAGLGDAKVDVESYASIKSLPIGLVAYRDNELCGIMALKSDSISTRSHLGPWAAAGFVAPEFRGQGVGANLLSGIEGLAKNRGFSRLYSGTSKAHGLLLRAGWEKKEKVFYGGADVAIYSKEL